MLSFMYGYIEYHEYDHIQILFFELRTQPLYVCSFFFLFFLH